MLEQQGPVGNHTIMPALTRGFLRATNPRTLAVETTEKLFPSTWSDFMPLENQDQFIELIRRLRAGESEAAEELVRRYESEIRLEVRLRLRMRDARLRRVFDSVDIVQSVLGSFFVRVALGQYELDDPARLKGLLIDMARRKLAEVARSQQRDRRDLRRVQGSSEEAGEVEDRGPDPERVVSARELLQQVQAKLTEEERTLCNLRFQGHGWAAIATTLGGTSDARRKQHARALDRVAKELGLADDETL